MREAKVSTSSAERTSFFFVLSINQDTPAPGLLPPMLPSSDTDTKLLLPPLPRKSASLIPAAVPSLVPRT